MRIAGCWGIFCALALSGMLQAQDDGAIRRSVVKVFCTSNQVDLSNPWKRGGTKQSTGSGIWLGERRILTNEHVVDYATQISVQPYESADRIPAELLVSAPEMDLAIIEVESDEPFRDLTPPQFARQLPKSRETVRVYGYPEGGSSLSVTEGIVSRIEYRAYSHGAMGLKIQVDAAINPGNSGGPAFVDDRVIGVAFQKRATSDNIGYLIPGEEVLAFLEDVEDEQYDGKPVLPIVYQYLLNKQLRSKLGLDPSTTGVWVREVDPMYEQYPLKKGDVITHIGDLNIDNSGNAPLRENLRVNFEYFVPELAQDGKLPVTVVRDGQQMVVEAAVNLRRGGVLKSLKGEYPSYFVYGPMVFAVATSEYLSGIENMLASSDARRRMSGLATMVLLGRRQSPILLRRFDYPNFEGEQMVIVANWLPHRITLGYSPPVTQVLEAVNGVKVKNLRHLVELLRDCDDDYVEFTLADRRVETLVFNREQLEEATEDILFDNGIPRQGSRELLEVWNEQ